MAPVRRAANTVGDDACPLSGRRTGEGGRPLAIRSWAREARPAGRHQRLCAWAAVGGGGPALSVGWAPISFRPRTASRRASPPRRGHTGRGVGPCARAWAGPAFVLGRGPRSCLGGARVRAWAGPAGCASVLGLGSARPVLRAGSVRPQSGPAQCARARVGAVRRCSGRGSVRPQPGPAQCARAGAGSVSPCSGEGCARAGLRAPVLGRGSARPRSGPAPCVRTREGRDSVRGPGLWGHARVGSVRPCSGGACASVLGWARDSVPGPGPCACTRARPRAFVPGRVRDSVRGPGLWGHARAGSVRPCSVGPAIPYSGRAHASALGPGRPYLRTRAGPLRPYSGAARTRTGAPEP